MSAVLTAHLDAARRALGRLRADAFGTVLSVVVIAGAIALPLFLAAVVDSARAAAKRLAADPVANVYLKPGADDVAARTLEKALKGRPGIRAVRVILRDDALAEMRRIGYLKDLLDGLEGNPLPHALALQLENREATELAALKTFLLSQPAVEEVAVDFEWADRIRRASGFLEKLAWLLALVLGVAVLFVIGNTTRLQILTQRDEIAVCRLIGASHAYVRRPLLYQGAIQGVLAGLLAAAVASAAFGWLSAQIRDLTASYGGFDLTPMTPEMLGIAVALAGVLGWLGAGVATGRHLHQLE
ncbi:MAG: FtsX-like permease family protein [Betaproteobacteria bacterium]|nr:FtsX-like permease family protein [Betaproteobacteria bacterium]